MSYVSSREFREAHIGYSVDNPDPQPGDQAHPVQAYLPEPEPIGKPRTLGCLMIAAGLFWLVVIVAVMMGG